MNGKEDKSDVKCFSVFSETFDCQDTEIYDRSLVSYDWHDRGDAEEVVQHFSEKEYYFVNGIIFSKKVLDEHGIKPKETILILKNNNIVK